MQIVMLAFKSTQWLPGISVSRHLIGLAIFAGIALAGCDAATQYDSGAVVLDVGEPQAFNSSLETTESFLSAYEALKTEDYALAEALLDQALTERPRDPYALLAMGSVHERTGRYYTATDYYQSAIRYGDAAAGETLKAGIETPVEDPRSVADVARANLVRLHSK